MIVTRAKSLIKAPSDGVSYYLVLSTNQLKLDGDNNWVGGNTVTVNVWRKSGEDEESQSGIESFSVTVKDDSGNIEVLRNNTYTFSFQASKSDSKYDVILKVDGKAVCTETVTISVDSPNEYTPYPQPTTVHFAKDTTGRALTPPNMTVNCGYRKTVKGVTYSYPGNVAGNIYYAEEKYFIYYRWIDSSGASGNWSLLYNVGSPYAITVSNNTTNIALEFCMTSSDTNSGISNTNTLWTIRVPISKDSLDGEPGSSGGSGRGIVSQTAYYLATTLAEGVTRMTDSSSWTTNYQTATPDKPYVWKYVKTVWSSGTSPEYTDPELIFCYNSGANPNLLEQTNFSSVASMTAWCSIGQWENEGMPGSSPGSITTGTQGKNAFQDTNSSLYYYKDMLQQKIRVSGGIQKIEPGQWYTLSFYGQGMLVSTYVYPNVIDTSAGVYIDGTFVPSIGSDGGKDWSFNSSWKRHTFTFKTLPSLTSSPQYVLFRLPEGHSYSCKICMPKLEVGMQATSYLSSENTLHNGQARGSRWALNTQYFCGAPDEKYDDTVLCGSDGFYHCIKTHISTENNKPGVGASWGIYWERGSKYNALATDIFLAAKAIIQNLIAPMVQTNYEGKARVEMFGSVFRIYGEGKNKPSIELAERDGLQVLRFYDQSNDNGKILYDLGPSGIANTPSQNEQNNRIQEYRLVGKNDNSDVNLDDAYSYESTIFKESLKNNYTYLYKYQGKMVAGVWDAGSYCATANGARQADGKIFLTSASSTSGGNKYIRDIQPFTGLFVRSGEWHATRDPSDLVESGIYGDDEAIPDDYDRIMAPPCDFSLGANGLYNKFVYWQRVYHMTDGVFDGNMIYYTNNIY